MTSAAFILMINLSVSALLAIAFLAIATYDRSLASARWIGAAYGFGIVYSGFELLISYWPTSTIVATTAYSALLLALASYSVGIAREYQVKPPWRLLGFLLIASILLNLYTQTLPRDLISRNVLWQAPYGVLQAVSVWILLRSRRLAALDKTLLGILALSAAYFVIKPLMAIQAGGPGASSGSYIDTVYALLSQSTGIVLALAVALMTLAIYVSRMLSDANLRSETDTLSGLLNRRGFTERAEETLRLADRSGRPVTLVLADIDHFKAVNDTYGHEAGDRVIQAFAQVMSDVAGGQAVGRIGGEEFAILMADTELSTARLVAEGARTAFSQTPMSGLGPDDECTASFGVAQRHGSETYDGLLRRADLALYEAKNAGRDCVRVAPPMVHPSGNGSDTEGRRTLRDKR
jgi:diguanylate cyclase (GGDEF)-like protein